jgi:cyclopropane fatty-acyl-phospholipid synthase-like methyltransferase
VTKANLYEHVTLELSNILDIELAADYYDYILFMESYPVIPRENLELIIRRLRRIIKPSGRIVFIHNLIERNEWSIGRALIKTNLKKLTTIDFGRLIVRADFEKWCIDAGLQLDSMQMIGEFNLPFPPCSSIRQYMYFWKSMYKNKHR